MGKNELKRLHPFLNTDDLEGGVWVPEDAVANPQAICKSLAKLASEGGAHYVTNCHIQNVVTEEDRIKGVHTSRGFIYCEYFVNCAGMVFILEICNDLDSVILIRLNNKSFISVGKRIGKFM